MAAKKSIRSMLVIKKPANNNTKQKAQIFGAKNHFAPSEIMWVYSCVWISRALRFRMFLLSNHQYSAPLVRIQKTMECSSITGGGEMRM